MYRLIVQHGHYYFTLTIITKYQTLEKLKITTGLSHAVIVQLQCPINAWLPVLLLEVIATISGV